jgi:O-antigen ligase
VTRFLQFLDRTVDLGLFFVLAFTPLAFGAVEEWSQVVAQFAILLIFAAWVLKLTWGPAPWRGPGEPRAFLGGRVQLSGLELPALAFVAVVLVQLIPLPPSVLRVVSPRTAEIYAQSLPGYGESENPSFAELPRWLQNDPDAEAGGVPALPPDPEKAARAMPPEVFDLSHPAWRPISLTPAHTRRALQVFLAHLLFFIVVFNHLATRQTTTRYLYVLAGLGGVVALIGILQDLAPATRLYWWRAGGPYRSFGPFVNANNFAGWMEMILPLTAGLAVMLWERERREAGLLTGRSGQNGRFRAVALLLTFAAVIGLGALVVSESRGGFLALSGAGVVALVVHLFGGRFSWRIAAAVVLVILLALTLAIWVDWPGLRERYDTLGDLDSDPSFRARLEFGGRTLIMARDFPVLGTGLGTFEEAYRLYTPGLSSKVLGRAHNDYAQVASECGLAGFLAAAWALVLLLTKGIGPGLVRRGTSFRWPVRGMAVGALALLLHSFVDFNLQIYSNSLLFVLFSSLLLRDRRGTLLRAASRPASRTAARGTEELPRP